MRMKKPAAPGRLNALIAAWGLTGTLALVYALMLNHEHKHRGSSSHQHIGEFSDTRQPRGNIHAVQPGDAYTHMASPAVPSPPRGLPPLPRGVLEELITSTTRMHGRLEKKGMPKRWRAQLSHMTNTQPWLHGLPASQWSPEIMQWMRRIFRVTDAHADAAESPSYRSPIPSCHYYIDHKYKIIYVRTSKTGGTTLSKTLGYRENPAVCARDKRTCYMHCQGKPMCMAYSFNTAELERYWKDYTVFGFVRNPLSRAVSSWAHIGKYGLERECHRPFADFAALPPAYGAPACAAYDRCCRQKFGWLLEHLEDQASCLLDLNGAPAVDFLGRVEALEEDFQELVKLINSQRPPGMPEISIPQLPRLMATDDTNAAGARLGNPAAAKAAKPITETVRQYAELYSNGTALADVIRYYQHDFQLLGFGEEIVDVLQEAGLGALADELFGGKSSSGSASASSIGGAAAGAGQARPALGKEALLQRKFGAGGSRGANTDAVGEPGAPASVAQAAHS